MFPYVPCRALKNPERGRTFITVVRALGTTAVRAGAYYCTVLLSSFMPSSIIPLPTSTAPPCRTVPYRPLVASRSGRFLIITGRSRAICLTLLFIHPIAIPSNPIPSLHFSAPTPTPIFRPRRIERIEHQKGQRLAMLLPQSRVVS